MKLDVLDVLSLAGAALVVVGVAGYSRPAGCIVAGLLLLTVAALGLRRRLPPGGR